jgi:hypothetical protein
VVGHQHLVLGLAGDDVLAVGEVTVGEGGVDAHLLVAVRQAVYQPLLAQNPQRSA